MALKYGFYNSVGGDRRYSAEDFSGIFDGIINDGVYASVEAAFAVEPAGGMKITIDKGRAWFNRTWTFNDAKYLLTVPEAESILNRIDAVVLEINTTESVRANSFKIVKGSPAPTPQKPVLTNADGVYQHPLAYIYVAAKATEIKAEDITYVVGTDECPMVSGILETISIDGITALMENRFEEWFEHVKGQLSEDVAGNLQNQIDQRVKISDKATDELALEGADDSKWMTPLKTKKAIDKYATKVLDLSTGEMVDLTTVLDTVGVSPVAAYAPMGSRFSTYDANNSNIAPMCYHHDLKKIFIGYGTKTSSGSDQYDVYIGYIDVLTPGIKQVERLVKIGGTVGTSSVPTIGFSTHSGFGSVSLDSDIVQVMVSFKNTSGESANYYYIVDLRHGVASKSLSDAYTPYYSTKDKWGYYDQVSYIDRRIYYADRGDPITSSTPYINIGTASSQNYYSAYLLGVKDNYLFFWEQMSSTQMQVGRVNLSDTTPTVSRGLLTFDWPSKWGSNNARYYHMFFDDHNIYILLYGDGGKCSVPLVINMDTVTSNWNDLPPLTETLATFPFDLSYLTYIGTLNNKAYFTSRSGSAPTGAFAYILLEMDKSDYSLRWGNLIDADAGASGMSSLFSLQYSEYFFNRREILIDIPSLPNIIPAGPYLINVETFEVSFIISHKYFTSFSSNISQTLRVYNVPKHYNNLDYNYFLIHVGKTFTDDIALFGAARNSYYTLPDTSGTVDARFFAGGGKYRRLAYVDR